MKHRLNKVSNRLKHQSQEWKWTLHFALSKSAESSEGSDLEPDSCNRQQHTQLIKYPKATALVAWKWKLELRQNCILKWGLGLSPWQSLKSWRDTDVPAPNWTEETLWAQSEQNHTKTARCIMWHLKVDIVTNRHLRTSIHFHLAQFPNSDDAVMSLACKTGTFCRLARSTSTVK